MLGGCVEDQILALEVRPPRAPDGGPLVPAEVRGWELRLERLEESEACPPLELAARGGTAGDLAHVQFFTAAEGMGEPIGEIPSGRWALSALARNEACTVLLHGCVELEIGSEASDRITLDVAPVTGLDTCGCRACEAGACTPLDRRCE